MEQLLLAAIIDQLRAIAFFLFGDRDDKPESVVAKLMGTSAEPETLSFSCPEEFEAARAEFLKRQRKEELDNAGIRY